jgi:hypothetical protein
MRLFVALEGNMLNGERVRSVTAQGLTYVDDEGVEKFIDFAQCYENYVKEMLSSARWDKIKAANNKTDADWDNYVERTKKWREVGRRNILTPPWGDGPFVELYTEPPTRFQFDSEEAYREITGAIRETGWRTADLS